MKNRHEYLFSTTNFKLPNSVLRILQDDCFNYGFVKNGKINLSGFLNDIIPKLSIMRESLHKEILKHNNNDIKVAQAVESTIFKLYLKQFDLEDDDDVNVNIPFRISNKSRDYFIYIEDNLLSLFNIDFTGYVRSLLKEYTMKNNINRELCYYNQELPYIKNAINKGQVIKIYKRDTEIQSLIPISLEHSNKNTNNFIIGYNKENDIGLIVKLASIKQISYLDEYFILDDEIIEELCDKSQKYLNEENY